MGCGRKRLSLLAQWQNLEFTYSPAICDQGGATRLNEGAPLIPDLIGTLKVIKSLGTSQSDLGSEHRTTKV